MIYHNTKIPIVTLSYKPVMLKNFLHCYKKFNNSLKDLYIVLNDNIVSRAEYIKAIDMKDYLELQQNIIGQSDIEKYVIDKYNIPNYWEYSKCVPNQIKLLIPIYLKEVRNLHNMLWLDDDIIVNCNLQDTLPPLMQKSFAEWKPIEKEKGEINSLFVKFWELSDKRNNSVLSAKHFSHFISCAFWFNIFDNFATYIQTYFQDQDLYNYLKEYTHDFIYKSGMGDSLNALEEFTFNYYCMMTSRQKANYWLPSRFHSWVDREAYFKDIDKVLKNNYFIHAHFQPKEQWVKLYFKDDFKQE